MSYVRYSETALPASPKSYGFVKTTFLCRAESRQSAQLFSSRRNWDSPNPSPAGECARSAGSGGRGTLAGERGGGRVPIPTKGHTLCGTLFIYVLCGVGSRDG
jgi:hypothetical protein